MNDVTKADTSAMNTGPVGEAQTAASPAPASNAVDAIEAAIEKAVGDITAERDTLKAKVAELESEAAAAAETAKADAVAAVAAAKADAEAAIAAAKAYSEKALDELKERMKPVLGGAMAERDALKAKIEELSGKIAAGAATVADIETKTFEKVDDEIAYLKGEIGKAVAAAEAAAARLADVVKHPALNSAMAFHASVASLKALITELL